jgi:hypothetical protein
VASDTVPEPGGRSGLSPEAPAGQTLREAWRCPQATCTAPLEDHLADLAAIIEAERSAAGT